MLRQRFRSSVYKVMFVSFAFNLFCLLLFVTDGNGKRYFKSTAVFFVFLLNIQRRVGEWGQDVQDERNMSR